MRRILRPRDAMAKLGIGRTKYYEDIRRGVLPPLIRMGPRCTGHIEEDLDAYIESLRNPVEGFESPKGILTPPLDRPTHRPVGRNVGKSDESRKSTTIST